MREPLFVGVDGGGTGCRVRVRDAAGALVGEAAGGTANIFAGVEAAAATVEAAVRAALAAGGLGAGDLSRCHAGLGLAGANVPSVAAELAALTLPFAAAAIESDAMTACRGAFAGEDGAVAIFGTGTAYALAAAGACRLLGGWGMLVSDQGSGADLGRRALAAAVLAHDGVLPRDGLCGRILAEFDGPDAIAEFARSARPRDFGRFAPLVWERFDAGDGVARSLVAEGLATIEAMLGRLLALGAPRLALLGGLAPRYRPLLAGSLAAHVVEPAGDAMEGALALARTLVAPGEGRA